MQVQLQIDPRLVMLRVVMPAAVLALMIGVVMAINTAFLQQPMRAVEGVQDLSGWSFDRHSRMALAGEWAFYWDDYLAPEQASDAAVLTAPTYLYLPGVWNGHLNQGIPLPRTGHGSLLLRVLLPAPGEYVLKVPTLTNDYRLWINGEPKVLNPDMESPGQARNSEATTRYIRFQSDQGEALVLVHLANYRHRAGGIWEPLYIAPANAYTWLHDLPIWRDILLGTLLAAIGVLALVRAYRHEQRAFVWLALFAFFMSLRAVTVEERLLFHVFQIYDWQWQQRIEHLVLYCTLPCMAFYLGERFRYSFPPILHLITTAMCASLILIVLITDAAVFSRTPPVFQLLGVFYAGLMLGFTFVKIAVGRSGAWLLFAGVFIQVLAGMNDIFYTNNVMDSINMLHVGALVFSVTQFFVADTQPRELQLGNAISLATVADPDSQNPYQGLDEKERIARIMQDTLALWDEYGEGGKLELAERSQQWRITNDNGTLKTRTLDKYLRAETLPSRPRLANVQRTVQFVLQWANLTDDDRQRLRQALASLQS